MVSSIAAVSSLDLLIHGLCSSQLLLLHINWLAAWKDCNVVRLLRLRSVLCMSVRPFLEPSKATTSINAIAILGFLSAAGHGLKLDAAILASLLSQAVEQQRMAWCRSWVAATGRWRVGDLGRRNWQWVVELLCKLRLGCMAVDLV